MQMQALWFNFRLAKETGFVDCTGLFLPEDITLVSNTVRVFQKHDNTYQYFDKNQFTFREDNPIEFQNSVDALTQNIYGSLLSVPESFTQNIIAYGGCNEEPIFTWGSDEVIDSAIKKWDIAYYLLQRNVW